MCEKCAKDTRHMLITMLTAALVTPLGNFTDHAGIDVNMDVQRGLIADVMNSMILRTDTQTETPEELARIEVSDNMLRGLDAETLRQFMLIAEYGESLFGNIQRVAQTVLAQRAVSGDREAQVRISMIDAIRAVAMASSDDGNPIHVIDISLGRGFAGKKPGNGPATDFPH